MTDIQDFAAQEIPDLPEGPWALIGEGLWSSIHDLGDGSVLKLVRRHGGLGSGESKYFREAAALGILGGLSLSTPRVPRLIASGRFENAYGYSGPPLAGWLRLEKMPGRPIDGDGLYALKSEERERLGEEIGAAMAHFHEKGTHLIAEAAKLGNPSIRSIDETLSRISAPSQRTRLETLKELWAAEEGPRVFLHGDLNFSNVLAARGAPVTFLDFAEAGVGLPEEDFRHFDNPGPMRDAIFRSYAVVSGHTIDMRRFRMSIAVNAAASLAIGSNTGHPREAMRRVNFLDEALRQAGVEA